MKYDEFAFFNQQLAAMLRDGIPLEGALRRLCDEMRRGKLRDELQALEADLARGTPMSDALNSRQLPELYKRMILVGIKSGDLPGALTMLADYFQQRHLVWTRLKGLMVYPLIVLTGAFLLSCFRRHHFELIHLAKPDFPGRKSFNTNNCSRRVDVAGFSCPRFGGGAYYIGNFTGAPCLALAAAGFPGSEPRTSGVGHVANVEKWCTARRRAGVGGTDGNGNQCGRGNCAMASAADFRSGKIFGIGVPQQNFSSNVYLDGCPVRRRFGGWFQAGCGYLPRTRDVSFRTVALLGNAVFHSGVGGHDRVSNSTRIWRFDCIY